MGLREDKRQRLRGSIIENSIALFRERGFERASVREIARTSEVSEATFFNHFPTKDAVLGHWACDEIERAFSDAATDARSLRALLRDFATRLAAGAEREPMLSSVAWARARLSQLRAPEVAIAWIEAAQESGEVRRDVSAPELARLLAATAATTVAASFAEPSEAAGEAAGTPPLRARLRQVLDLVLDGSRRRHERVRPGAPPRSSPQAPVRTAGPSADP